MSAAPHFQNSEEQAISRGGKGTAIVTWTLAAVVIAGGITLAMALRREVSPPARPGTTSATTTAGQEKPPSP
jgi:hypothetical protein